MATDVTWLLGETNLLERTCIRLPFLNLLAGAAKGLLLVWRPCEPLPILAAARVDATSTVVLLFATTRRLPRAGIDKQPSDYPARGANNKLILRCCMLVTNDTKHDDGLNWRFVRPNVRSKRHGTD